MFSNLRTTCAIICALFLSGCSPEKPIMEKQATVRISTETEPHTFDPRQVRNLSDTTYMNLLYEGLTRSEKDGKIVPGMAETYAISKDKKKYIFKMRKTEWSDGQPVTANDFFETWKTILDPDFPAPNAYQLYVIKGAKDFKEGKISFEEVGIKALDDTTLVVELENPTPYFLNLTSSYFLYPAHRQLRLNSETNHLELVTNGPFQLEKTNALSNEWTMVPNTYYWDRNSVRLDQVKILKLENSTALQLFEQKELDWAGSPLSTIPVDTLTHLKGKGKLNIQPASGVYFLRVNTEHPPFDNTKFRRALAFALNRSDLVEHVLQGNQIPAQRYIPDLTTTQPLYKDNDLQLAKHLFAEALQEQHLSSSSLPKVSICYANNPRSHKIAQVIQQNWKEAFNLQVELQNCESKVFYDHLKNHTYQIGIGSWFADIHDPISFLEVFKYKNNGTNNTQWENPNYIDLINQSANAKTKKRESLLKQAEELLIKEMPIIPLFFSTYNYLQNPDLKGVYFSDLGYLDLKYAYFEKNLPEIAH